MEGDVLEYKSRCVVKNRGKFRLRIGTKGGRPDAGTKENTVLETVRGILFLGDNAKKCVHVLDEGRGEMRIRKRQNAVSEI